MTPTLILAFLDHLESDRHNAVRSRNARLAALRTFLKFAAHRDVTALHIVEQALGVPMKRFERPMLGFLTREEMLAVIGTPGASWISQRDVLLLALLYNTGARVSELIGVKVADVVLAPAACVDLHGKGRKQRSVPLWHHPHLHCVVPGGGVSLDGQRWIACRPGFFLPVRVLSALFRRLFLTQLRQAFKGNALHFFNALAPLQEPHAFAKYLAPVADADWVVYAKKPFGGPEQVLEYLGRYTHRVAISNNRLVEFADGQVAFQWKDYRQESQPKVMRLDASEFTRRFLLHVLPPGLQRIRHYGLLANCHREVKLEQCRQLLAAPAPPPPEEPADYLDQYQRLTGISLRDCPQCGKGQMVRIESFLPGTLPRGPPCVAP